ncbi:MAG: hypothetical protein AAF841_02065 [Pseudomonadota bacterium]
MSDHLLTKIRLREGIWEGILNTGSKSAPELSVTHLEMPLEGVEIEPSGDGAFHVKVPIPSSAIADGVQTFLIQDKASGETLAQFAIAADAPLSEDLRAEVNLLRAELDMLKRAFRRHCVETGA